MPELLLLPMDHETETAELQELAQAFDFTLEQLAANRTGSIGDGQLDALWPSAIGSVLLALIGLGLAAAALKHAPGAMKIVGPLMALVCVLVGGLLGSSAFRDLHEKRVAVLDGEIEEMTSTRTAEPTAIVHVQSVRLLTKGRAHAASAAIRPGTRYLVYHLPHSKRLLSIEPR